LLVVFRLLCSLAFALVCRLGHIAILGHDVVDV
jgi:hypothetical protein